MSQTSRKRQTKHRGNAAGMVTSRGRTSRPPDPKERKEREKQDKQLQRAQAKTNVPVRYQSPPTWKSSAIRATIPTVMIFPILLLLHRSPGEAVGFALTAFVIYVPMTYLLDSRMYRRYQRKAVPPGRTPKRPAAEQPAAPAKATTPGESLRSLRDLILPNAGRSKATSEPSAEGSKPVPRAGRGGGEPATHNGAAEPHDGAKTAPRNGTGPKSRDGAKPTSPANGKPKPAGSAKPTPKGSAKPTPKGSANPAAKPTPKHTAKPTPRHQADSGPE